MVADNGFGEWGGRDAEIGELIYVSCICYVVAFLFASPTMESYQDLYKHSEKGLAGTSHEYLVLETSNPPMEEHHNISFEKYCRQHDAEIMQLSASDGHNDGACTLIFTLQMNHICVDTYLMVMSSAVDSKSITSATNDLPVLRRIKSPISKRFCLETACIMMECSWQSYFMPLDEPRSEAEAAARLTCQDVFATALGTAVMLKMDVAQYGLRFVRSFLSPHGDISGYLARDDRRVVVSFRGTVGGSNMVTDLNMIQTQLPNMSLSDSHIHQLFRDVMNEQKGNVSPNAKSDEMWHDILERSRNTDGQERVGGGQGGAEGSSPMSSFFTHRSLSSNSEGEEPQRLPAGRLSTITIASDDSSVLFDDQGRGPDPDGDHAGHGVESGATRCLKAAISMIPLARQALPLVHYGFWQAYQSVRDEFLKTVLLGILQHYKEKQEKLYRCQSSSSYENFRHSIDNQFVALDGLSPDFRNPLDLYLCGHSLGGALSVLAALDLQKNAKYMVRIILNYLFSDEPVATSFIPPVALTVYTFGSPRIGNATFSKHVEQTVKDIFRVEVDGDMICRVPHLWGMYRHCGVHIIIDSEEAGNLIVNPTVVEDQLLRRGSGTTDHHSLAKYRVCLEACFLPHELEAYLRRCFLHAERLNGKSNVFADDYDEVAMPEWM